MVKLPPVIPTHSIDDRGAALVLVLVSSLCLTSIGLGLVTLADAEQAASANYQVAHETIYAADAIAERVIQDLWPMPDWSAALAGVWRSDFYGSTTPSTAYGETLDMRARTAEVQALSNARAAGLGNAPDWRLFAHGPIQAIAEAGLVQGLAYVAAWIADDPAETDGDPRVDTNGVVMVLTQALGVRGARRTVVVTIARGCVAPADVSGGMARLEDCMPGARSIVRVLSWREVR